VQIRKKRRYFFENEYAVLGLPMRLTVSLFIGTLALIAILSYILNPCLIPGRMVISVTPIVTTLSVSEPENISLTVYVNETKGQPLSGASVIIKGLGGAGSGFSDNNGKVQIQLRVQLQRGVYEGYLSISVKAACHEPFEHQDMLKVVKTR
jgi:hypothetical protein